MLDSWGDPFDLVETVGDGTEREAFALENADLGVAQDAVLADLEAAVRVEAVDDLVDRRDTLVDLAADFRDLCGEAGVARCPGAVAPPA